MTSTFHGIQSPQAIGRDGTVYTGSVIGAFYAFHPDGSVRWKIQLGSHEITAAPAIARDGTIYIAAEDGVLHALTPHGVSKWKFALGSYAGPSASPVIGSDGTIYIGADKFFAINPNGSLKWSFDTGNFIAGPPAIADDGTLYFPSTDYLYAVNSGGTLKWRASGHAEYPPGSAPAVGKDGTIYVNTSNGVLHAYTPNGSFKWKFATPGIVTDVPSSPAIAKDGTIYFGGAGEYQGSGGYFYALTPKGKLKWNYFAGCGQTAATIGGDGTIYFGSDSCFAIHALNRDGTEKWPYTNLFDYRRRVRGRTRAVRSPAGCPAPCASLRPSEAG
jgi:outer membrane protein assembly factor BamB